MKISPKNLRYLFFGAVLVIFISGFVLRLYRFNNPIADWHSWRQTDTAAVSKIYSQDGIDLLKPRYYDISNVQTGMDNPEGLRYVEFPIYNIIHASLINTWDTLSADQWGRLLSILSSTLSGLFVFLIAYRYFGKISAIGALFFYMFLPFSIFFGRVILPDVMMVTASLGGLYFFSNYIEKERFKYVNYFIALILTSASFLLKPFALFFVLPIVAISWNTYSAKMFKRLDLWFFALISLVPLILWRVFISSFPEGIPASNWLFNEGNIRFKGAFFYWIFGERVAKLILGYFGVVLLFVGLFKAKKDTYLLLLSFLASALIYLFVVARGNVQHDYYQILILPAVAILLGRGVSFLVSLSNGKTNRIVSLISLSVVSILSIFLSWYYVRDYFNINNEALVIAGKTADKILPKEAKVIAPYNGDTTLLYYINRKGWPVFQASVEELKSKGATHMVLVNPPVADLKDYEDDYNVISSGHNFLIISL